ncbi:GGDEF domain-containing protein [Deefgea tanakiae]|uniref:diguanylate cyclase n=1 Tax=Deefgea tanakiae TaxID=2865840 RepID=A0ABX8Z262_9NEIS|nr:GGDEF domain-containing protein [Deefgea tanakiae]QZA76671.1 GGDEF domain-containing protein [Deefgea tanakiae]
MLLKSNPSDLLHSLAELTGLIDRDDLAASLCLTLFEMMQADSMDFYRVFHRTKQLPSLHLLVEFDQQGIRQHSIEQLRSKHPQAPIAPDGFLASALHNNGALAIDPSGFRVILCLRRETELYALLDLTLSRGLSPADLRMLQGFVRIYENHIALLDYGETDTLTGLLNRKTLERQFLKIVTALQNLPSSQALQQNNRDTGSAYFFLVVLDIDHFKRVNDKFGHLFGDEVLLTVSQIMRQSFREIDYLFRFGGEEFVVILGPQTRESVGTALNRFREAVAAHEFAQIGTITISGGITDIRPYEVLSITLGRADLALYAAKDGGRNQMMFFDTLPESEIESGSDELF